MHNYSMSNNSFRGYDFLFGGDRNESHGCLVARQNRWAAYGQSSPRWTTLTGSPRNRKAIYRFSAPPKDSRYRLIGTERIIVDDMRASSNEKSRGGDDCRNFLKNFSFFFPLERREVTVFLVLVACYLEPVGSVRPKIPSTDDVRGLRSAVSGSQALICPAQGFPVPSNR